MTPKNPATGLPIKIPARRFRLQNPYLNLKILIMIPGLNYLSDNKEVTRHFDKVIRQVLLRPQVAVMADCPFLPSLSPPPVSGGWRGGAASASNPFAFAPRAPCGLSLSGCGLDRILF